MLSKYIKRLFAKNREFILDEFLEARGLMQLLMKHRNTGEKWTKEEIKELRLHFINLSKVIPVLIVFLLPGGSFFLPLLAEVLDRRKDIR